MSRIVNFPCTSDAVFSPVLVYQLKTQLNVFVNGATSIDNTGTLHLQCTIPDEVTDDQVRQVIADWKPTDTIPPPPDMPATLAVKQIQRIVNGVKWSDLTPAHKDQLLQAVVQVIINTTLS